MERNDGHFPFWRYAIWGLLLVVLIFIGFYILITHVDRSEYQKIVDLANNNVSFLGMCIYIWATDTFVLPLSPMFVFPFIVEYPWYFAIPFTGLSSALGGMTAYFIGFVFSKFPFIRRMTDKAYQKWGNVIRKYGLMCVLLSSLLPLPFSTVAMVAGMMHLNAGKVALISLTRIIRMAIYYAMFSLGLMVA